MATNLEREVKTPKTKPKRKNTVTRGRAEKESGRQSKRSSRRDQPQYQTAGGTPIIQKDMETG